MASLTDKRIDLTYKGLIKTEDNAEIGSELKLLTDGAGNSTGISVNSNGDLKATAFYGDGSNLTGIGTADTLQEVTNNGNTTSNTITVAGLTSAGLRYPLTDGISGQIIATDGAGNLTFVDPSQGTEGTLQQVTDNGSTTTNIITIGGLVSSGITYPSTDGTAGQILATDGLGNLSFVNSPAAPDLQEVTDQGSVTDNTIVAAGFVKTGGTATQFLKADGSVDSNVYLTSYTETSDLQDVTDRGATTTNAITVGGLTAAGLAYPSLDGNAGQVLGTDGAGNLAFVNQSGGVTSLENMTGDINLIQGANILIQNDTVNKTITISSPSVSTPTLDDVLTAGNSSIRSATVSHVYVSSRDVFFGTGTSEGVGSFGSASSGDNNYYLGTRDGSALADGSYNVKIGYQTLASLTTGDANVSIGHLSLYDNTTGNRNIAIGKSSLNSNTTGNDNIAIGLNAMSDAESFGNIAIGSNALLSAAKSGSNRATAKNIAIGNEALENYEGESGQVYTGNNIAIGERAGHSWGSPLSTTQLFVEGGNNIFIGNYASASAANTSDEIVIGNLTVGNGQNTITLGTSFDELYVEGVAAHTISGSTVVVNTVTGQIGASASSLRYKENVQDYNKGLDAIDALRAVSYNLKTDSETQQVGFIAEEVEEAGLTEFVLYNKEGQPESLNYPQMVALLAKGIQELRAEVELLKSK